MKFDAYGATIREQEFSYVAESLASSIGAIVAKGKPMRRYSHVLNIDDGPRMAAWVGWDTQSGNVYVEGKGDTTPRLAQAIRVHFPEHSAARIDVAEDYDGPEVFDALQRLVRANKGPKVKGGYVALPDDVEDGKTWTAGVRGGVGYVRVYEAGKHPDRLHLGRPNWVRAEAEMRPHYARDKVAAARMSPLDVWGLSAWTHRVGQALTQCDINRWEPEIRQLSQDKTTRYLALTFRRHWEQMLEDGLHIQATIEQVWKEHDELHGVSGS